MTNKALPLLLLGGAALLLLGGKKSGGGSSGGIYEEDLENLPDLEPELQPKKGASGKANFDPLILTHQMNLRLLGYYNGPIDGINGSGTKSAVKEFQRDTGLEVDGVIGPNTSDMLVRAIQARGLMAKAQSTLEKYKEGLGF